MRVSCYRAFSEWVNISDQSLRYQIPVCPVEELFLHMVILAGPRWTRWMFIVEDQLRRLAVACFQETHHLPVVAGMLPVRLFAAYLRHQAMCHDFCLKVGSRATLVDRQIGGIAQRVNSLETFDLQSLAVGGQPALLVAQTRILDHLCSPVRGDHHQ